MLDSKYERLQEILTEMKTVVIAFSGGVDSTFLLKAALDTLGRENVLAVTADSETYPFEELGEAIKLAKFLGARHEVIQTSELNIIKIAKEKGVYTGKKRKYHAAAKGKDKIIYEEVVRLMAAGESV